MPPKRSAEERAKALETFRHKQTLKRWEKGNVKKPSKIVYLSDLFDSGPTSHPKGDGVPSTKARHLLTGTLLVGGHRGGGVMRRPAPQIAVSRSRRRAGQRAAPSKKKKQANPEGGAPFNNRKQFTALKRRIHEQRRAALLERLAATESGSGSPDEPCHEDNNENNTACTAKRAEGLVREIEALHVAMDAAMRGRQYSAAGVLKRQIRRRRFALRRLLVYGTWKQQLPTGEDPSASSDGDDALLEPPPLLHKAAVPYVNHFPSTVLLGVGRHPHAEAIDRRTGRYPMKLPSAVIRSFVTGAVELVLGEEERLADYCTQAANPTTDEGGGTNTPTVADSQGEGKQQHKQQHQSRRPPLFVAMYCRNLLTDFLDDLTFTTLQALYHEQGDLRRKQPKHFKARQRYVVGLNETLKHLRAGRVRLVILAADIEVGSEPEAASNQGAPAGTKERQQKTFATLDDAIHSITMLCHGSEAVSATVSASTPILITCMSCQRLSYALFAKRSKVSCVGIIHAEKNHEMVKALRLAGQGLRSAYVSAVPPA